MIKKNGVHHAGKGSENNRVNSWKSYWDNYSDIDFSKKDKTKEEGEKDEVHDSTEGKIDGEGVCGTGGSGSTEREIIEGCL